MPAHNHDTKTGKKLQKKAEELKDEKIINAIIKADIKGLSRDEARAKLNNVIEEVEEVDENQTYPNG